MKTRPWTYNLTASNGESLLQRVTGAQITERIEDVLYVSTAHPKASDQSLGTEDSPLKTLKKAVEMAVKRNAMGRGERFLWERVPTENPLQCPRLRRLRMHQL